MAINCLRCNVEIKKYRNVSVDLPIDGQGDAYTATTQALAICPACGHFEILNKDSQLLAGMEKIPNVAEK
jgi:hypothetical protein